MKKNIRIVMLGELLLIIVAFMINDLYGVGGRSIAAIGLFIDLPSLIFILVVLIPGLLIMGVWKDFIKSFSVGIKQYSLLELKNIIGAVDAAQKLTIFAALFAIIISGIRIVGNANNFSPLGPYLSVCLIAGLYAVILEFFLLPLRLNAERKMNEEMDFENE
jgi:hypothetical protein